MNNYSGLPIQYFSGLASRVREYIWADMVCVWWVVLRRMKR
jgi:hypothetical protein